MLKRKKTTKLECLALSFAILLVCDSTLASCVGEGLINPLSKIKFSYITLNNPLTGQKIYQFACASDIQRIPLGRTLIEKHPLHALYNLNDPWGLNFKERQKYLAPCMDLKYTDCSNIKHILRGREIDYIASGGIMPNNRRFYDATPLCPNLSVKSILDGIDRNVILGTVPKRLEPIVDLRKIDNNFLLSTGFDPFDKVV